MHHEAETTWVKSRAGIAAEPRRAGRLSAGSATALAGHEKKVQCTSAPIHGDGEL